MPHKKITTPLVFILTAIFYIYTLLPSLAWGDGVKLQSEAISGESFILSEMSGDEFSPDPFIFSRVGVAAWDHPLYIILGHSLVRAFPSVDSLWLVNLISAFFGAASIALVFRLCYRFTGSPVASLYAGFSLAVSHTFWWHSTTPEVYTLLVFLLLISFYCFEEYEKTGKRIFLVYSIFFLGLAASNHILAFLVMPALAFYYIFSGGYRDFRLSDFRKFAFPVLAFLPGFSIYIVQFIRMSANFPLKEIMGPVVGSTFLSQLLTMSPGQLGESILSYFFFLTVQFGPIGLIFGVLGIRKTFDTKALPLRKIVSFFLVFALFGIFYRVTDQFTFFITSYVFWAMLIGLGADYTLGLIPGKTRAILLVILGLQLLVTPFFYNALPRLAEISGLNDDVIGIPKIGTDIRNGLAYYTNPNKRGDYDAVEFGSRTLANLAPDSVVIAEWYTDTDEYFILRYYTKIELVRSDLTVVGWPTHDPFAFDSRLALGMIEDTFPERPVYLASLSDRFYASSKLIENYCIVPENNLYRLYQKESNDSRCLGNDSVTE